MNSKEMVLRAVSQLPDDAAVGEINRQVEFVAGVAEALAQVERGETYTVEEVREYIKDRARKWAYR